MNDLYWISVLGSLQSVVCVISFLAIIVCVITTIAYFNEKIDNTSENVVHNLKVIATSTFCTFIVTIVLNVFLPTKDDLYCIYGVGQTIDYLKSNKEAKQLPDKAVRALNVYLDSQIDKDSIK